MGAGNLFGRGISFPPRIGPEGRVVWSEGEANVRESIRVILMTEARERLGLSGFGAGLGRFLFEPNTAVTHMLIKEHITNALTRWEPRLTLESILVEPDRGDPYAAVATITYKLVATQQRERVSLNVALGTL